MSTLDWWLLAVEVAAAAIATFACLTAYKMHRRCDRLWRQIAEERILASDEQARIIAVVAAEAGHEVAWRALEAAAPPRERERPLA